MKQILKRKIYFCIYTLTVVMFIASCSDISETQKEYTDIGEQIYVGILDSVSVEGGINRAIINGKNTYMRNAVECAISWVSSLGESNERSFTISDYINDGNISINITDLEEGDYQFYVQTVDSDGNRSIAVECFGSVYGDVYKETQMPVIITNLICDLESNAYLSLSECEYLTALKVNYVNTDDEPVELVFNSVNSQVVLPKWRAGEEEVITLTTSILPTDKNGIDTLVLTPEVVNITKAITEFDVDKTLWSTTQLTAYDDQGGQFGFGGPESLVDGLVTESANQICSGGSFPIHYAFDMGTNLNITQCSVIGRQGESTWDLVKFEIWGRESIDDGPDGDTGYKIMSKSTSDEFEDEAIQRGWKCVGKGWHIYDDITPTTTSTVDLTDVDDSIKPRYILFRVMSVIGGGTNTSADGGLTSGYFCCSELSFKAKGELYNID